LALYRERIGISFGCNLRPEMVRPAVVRTLAEAGCGRVHMGLESGSEAIRREVLGRPIADEDLEAACRLLQEAGIQVLLYNLLGLPREDVSAVLRTIKLNARLAPDHIQHSIFFPFPGTELHGLVVREGLLADREVTDYFSDSALDLPGLSRGQVLFFQARFKALVRWYRTINRLPPWLGLGLAGLTDLLLGWRITAWLGRSRRRKGPS
jgi:radical SAM superfamily enzyme YgiQ (UPF0313 family)